MSRYDACNASVVRINSRIDMNWVSKFISAMETISKTRKEFYIAMLTARYEKMLKEPYVKLTGNEKIELIVKNKDENIIHLEVISNFIYFEHHFEKI